MFKISGFSIILFFLIYNFIYAQDSGSLSLEISVPDIQQLYIEDIKSFPPITPMDYDKGYMEIKNAVTLSVSSNVPWKVVVFTNRVNLYVSPGKFKSVDNFQLREGLKPFQTISKEPKVVLEGKAGVKDLKIDIDYLLNVSWKNTPTGRWEFQPEFRIE